MESNCLDDSRSSKCKFLISKQLLIFECEWFRSQNLINFGNWIIHSKSWLDERPVELRGDNWFEWTIFFYRRCWMSHSIAGAPNAGVAFFAKNWGVTYCKNTQCLCNPQLCCFRLQIWRWKRRLPRFERAESDDGENWSTSDPLGIEEHDRGGGRRQGRQDIIPRVSVDLQVSLVKFPSQLNSNWFFVHFFLLEKPKLEIWTWTLVWVH